MWTIKATDHSYRFLKRYKFNVPYDFCSYYRKVVLCGVGLTVLGLICLSPIFSIVTYCMHLWDFSTLIWADKPPYPLAFVFYTCFGLALSIIAVIGLIIYLMGTFLNRKRNFYLDKSQDKQSFIKTWYKSWKEKYCPLIQFKE